MVKKKKFVYQSGGTPQDPEGLGALFGGLDLSEAYGNLFDLGEGTGQSTGYHYNGTNYDTEDEYLQAYYGGIADNLFPKDNRRSRKRKEKYLDRINQQIESGSVDFSPILDLGKQEYGRNYMGSDEFKQGFSDLMGQVGEYRDNMQASKNIDTVDHFNSTVGIDRGFGAFKKGGQVGQYQQGGAIFPSAPMAFLSLDSGIGFHGIEKFARAVREHEGFSDYTTVQPDGSGRGAYQFTPAALKTAAKKAKKIYEEMEMNPPTVYDDILSGTIKEAQQLHPNIQDELFFSNLTKIKPVKDKNGRIKRYDIGINEKLHNYDLSSASGMADAWQDLHNKGTKDRRTDFLTSMARIPEFQKGGLASAANYLVKHNKAKKGDQIATAVGMVTKGDNDVAILGYRDDSPYNNRESITIPGNIINMDNVSKSLQLTGYDKDGKNLGSLIATPNSGSYTIPGAAEIKEVPLFQMGGEVQPSAIQTEKGELVTFQDGSISNVKAKKKHKQMKPNEVTDIVPPMTYVLSDDKNMKLSKKDADNISFGYGSISYLENESSPAPKEMLFGDVFKKKTHKPSELGRIIKRKYPVTDREDDLFADRAKQENKEARFPLIEALKLMSEAKKEGVPIEQFQYGGFTGLGNIANQPTNTAITNQMYGDPVMKRDNNMMKDGIYTKPLYSQSSTIGLNPQTSFGFQRGGTVPHYQGGGSDPISGIINAVVGAGNMIGDWLGFSASAKARKRIEDNQAQTEQELQHFRDDQRQRNEAGLTIGSLSSLAQFASQDPSYEFLNLDPIRHRTRNTFDNAKKQTRATMRNIQEGNDAMTGQVYRNLSSVDPRAALNIASVAQAQNLRQTGQIGLQFNDRITDLDLRGELADRQMGLQQEMDRQQGTLYERAGRNILNKSLFQSLGDEGQSFLDRETQADLTALSARMASRGQSTGEINKIAMYQAGRRQQGVRDLGTLYDSYQQNRQTNYNAQDPYGYNTDEYGFQDDQWTRPG